MLRGMGWGGVGGGVRQAEEKVEWGEEGGGGRKIPWIQPCLSSDTLVSPLPKSMRGWGTGLSCGGTLFYLHQENHEPQILVFVFSVKSLSCHSIPISRNLSGVGDGEWYESTGIWFQKWITGKCWCFNYYSLEIIWTAPSVWPHTLSAGFTWSLSLFSYPRAHRLDGSDCQVTQLCDRVCPVGPPEIRWSLVDWKVKFFSPQIGHFTSLLCRNTARIQMKCCHLFF